MAKVVGNSERGWLFRLAHALSDECNCMPGCHFFDVLRTTTMVMITDNPKPTALKSGDVPYRAKSLGGRVYHFDRYALAQDSQLPLPRPSP